MPVRNTVQIDLIDLELLIRALTKERRLLHEPDLSETVEDPERAFYDTLDPGDLNDRLTRLLKFFRERKKVYAHRGVEVELELRVESLLHS